MADLAVPICNLVSDIVGLSKQLNSITTVLSGVKDDKIYRVFTTVRGDSHWETFNRRFDAVFGKDCIDSGTGDLLHLRSGRYGMDAVARYLQTIADMEEHEFRRAFKESIAIVELRLERLRDALRSICAKVAVSAPVQVQSVEMEPENVPIRSAAERSKMVKETDPKDKTYKPPRRARAQSEETCAAIELDSDGHEVTISDDESLGRIRVPATSRKSKRARVPDTDSDDNGAEEQTKAIPSHNKKKPKKPRTNKPSKASRDILIESQSESDGNGALREVEHAETTRRTDGRRGPRNLTLQHWHTPKATKECGLGDRWVFACKYCDTKRTFRRTVASTDFDDETVRPDIGNLSTHTRKSHSDKVASAADDDDGKRDPASEPTASPFGHPYTLESAKLMEKFLEQGKLNPRQDKTQKGFLRLFAAWLLEEDLPWTTGEAPSLRRLFEYAGSKFMLPSDTTVRNTLVKILAEMHENLVKELADVKSKIAFQHDTWTTAQMMFSFAATIANFVDEDWHLVERLVDFYHLQDDEHCGVESAHAFFASVKKRANFNQFIALTMDNAAANDVLVRTLGLLLLDRYGIQFSTENAQIRCLAHVVNLVVQKILSVLDDAADPDDDDYYAHSKNLPFHYDLTEDEELNDLEKEIAEYEAELEQEAMDTSDDLEDMESSPVSDVLGMDDVSSLSVVQKLRLVTRAIVRSPQRRSAFHKLSVKNYKNKIVDGHKLWMLMVIRDVRTRWNSTHAMIDRALLLRKAVDDWVWNQDGELRSLLLHADDWEFLQKLSNLLQLFTRVTHTMSRSGMPTLPWVLPMYAQMHDHLASAASGSALVDPKASISQKITLSKLRSAASAGLEKLNKYYNLAKGCQANVIATVCHPSLRLNFFSGLADKHRYVHAKALFEHVYKEYALQASQSTPSTIPVPTATPPSQDFLSTIGNISATPLRKAPERSELERWFDNEGGFAKEHDDPLTWWRENHHSFPVIARMAKDFFAISAVSVGVERLFSRSKHMCTDARSSLRAETISQAMCAKEWIKQGLLHF